MNPPTYTGRWATARYGSAQMSAAAPERLRQLVSAAELDARLADEVCEVDLLADGARPGFPMLVQFLVGRPSTSVVLIHDERGAFLVELPRLTSAVPLSLLADVVETACRTGRVPASAHLVEQAMD